MNTKRKTNTENSTKKLSDAATIVEKCVALDMKKIDADGLRAFIKSKQLSIRGFARVLGVNSKTVDNWLRVGRFTGVARKSIEGGLARAYMADRWENQSRPKREPRR